MALVAVSIPGGVICLISALCYYDLTDQIMREVWIAVPHESHPPKRPNTRIDRDPADLWQNLTLERFLVRLANLILLLIPSAFPLSILCSK